MDVVQGERRDLIGPQAETGQQDQYCIVSLTNGTTSITTYEYLLNLLRRKNFRQRRKLPGSYAGDSTRKIEGGVTSV